jgi:hypothetical protein
VGARRNEVFKTMMLHRGGRGKKLAAKWAQVAGTVKLIQ